MNNKNLLIGGVVVIGLSVAAYFAYQAYKSNQVKQQTTAGNTPANPGGLAGDIKNYSDAFSNVVDALDL